MDNELRTTSIKPSAFAALALAFASFGDAFLYPFLPVNFQLVGVPLSWVGLLLSINRLVRIVSNTILVNAFAKYGLRSIMIIAVVFAITSTFGYAMASTLIAWLFFRIVWGLAFSAMRIGTLGYALENERKGFALGISRSLQETGPMVALFIAPWLLGYFQSKWIFFILGLLSIPALYFALSLPRVHDKSQHRPTPFMRWPSMLSLITLISAVVIDGIVVVVLGVLFLHYRDNISMTTATMLAAFYLGFRRICLVILSPAGGLIAQRVGLERIFNVSMFLVVVGLIVMVAGWIGAGSIIVFAFYSINAAVGPGLAAEQREHSLAAVAENATWRDIGAALGTLIGGFLIASEHLTTILFLSTLILILFLFVHVTKTRRTLNPFVLWK